MSLLDKTAVLPVQTYFPGSPYDGETFIYTTTGRKISYSYDAITGLWVPGQSYGTTRLYVDPANGTDDLNHGFGTGTDAFATLEYAINMLPLQLDGENTITGGYSVVITCTGTMIESFNVSGKISPSHSRRIYIHGGFTEVTTGVATGGAKGAAAVVPNVTGAFAPGANVGKLIAFTSGANNGLYRIIGQTTAGAMYLNGRTLNAAPINGDTYTIYDWNTTFKGVMWLDFGAFPFVFSALNFEFDNLPAGWDSYGLAVFGDATLQVEYCRFYNNTKVTTGVAAAQGGWVRMDNCYCESYGQLSMLRAENLGQISAFGVKLVHDDVGFGAGFVANRQGHVYIHACEVEGFYANILGDSDGSGEINSTVINSYIHGAKVGAGFGIKTQRHGIVSGQASCVFGLLLDGVTADANPGGNTSNDAASQSWIG